ncbi:hypothetical protein A2U01_0077766, partial [Trifolium medium]|nr:hypothetical protein [Trifolium medium]
MIQALELEEDTVEVEEEGEEDAGAEDDSDGSA